MKSVRLTIYDAVGYFVPGAVLLWSLRHGLVSLGSSCGDHLLGDLPAAAQVAFLATLSYVGGHILHGLANFTIDRMPFGGNPPRNYFREHFHCDFSNAAISSLAAAISRRFGLALPAEPDGRDSSFFESTYWLCYTFGVQEREDGLTSVFQALHGLYRALTLCCLISAILFAASAVRCWRPLSFSVSVTALLLTLLFAMRAARFGRHVARTALADFLCLALGSSASQSTPRNGK